MSPSWTRVRGLSALGCTAAAFGCGPIATAGPGCTPVQTPVELSRELNETSGVAVGRADPEVLWTHEDGDSELHALNRTGALLGSFDVPVQLRDWEDIEVAPCGVAGSCLYLADTGDNRERRPPGQVRIIRVPEPAVENAHRAPAGPVGADGGAATGAGLGDELAFDVFPLRLPDGPRDIEALFVLPGEVPYLVTKGANHPVTVYRYPPPLRRDTVTVVEIQRLTDAPQPLLNRVTGASASPDGSSVVIRTYQALQFYQVDGGRLVPLDGGITNLRPLREIQGEGVGVGPEGVVALTSEGGPLGGPPSLRLLRCATEAG